MKRISAVVLCAALGLAAAGCASGRKVLARTAIVSRVKAGTVIRSKVFPRSITIAGTLTISNVKAGTVVRCRGEQLTETVPEIVPGQSVGESSSGQWSVRASGTTTSSQHMQVTPRKNGVLTVSCSP